jgi:predicted AAA+ superfamily ATPase
MQWAPRLYDQILAAHFADHRQMAWVSGPRQVGKTTCCRRVGTRYFNWDNTDDRRIILRGPAAVAEATELPTLQARPPIVVFDELHKFGRWRGFLKGFFDTYGERARSIVTGSSRLEIFRRGGDSLMGRYFLYRMHPLSVAECLHTTPPVDPIRAPQALADATWSALWQHGGFPEPFLRREVRFTNRWRALRHEQFFQHDVREVAQLQELASLETFATLLTERSGQQLVHSNLAQEVGIAVDTARRWVDLLGRLHYGFLVRPWFANVAKSLRKEPKWFLRDWSGIADPGARAKTLVACHLLKAVEGWTDLGLGRFELRYLRDKMKREVDFLLVRDRKPWFLVEVKTSERTLSPTLTYFQTATGAPHAFQAVIDLAPVEANCFASPSPMVVPARTLLSQLL